MRIMVADGQGGGIGKHIIAKLRACLPPETEIIALGTNAIATSAMLKAGANDGATGENAFVVCAPQVDLIIGTVDMVMADAMLGEVTPSIAAAIARSPAKKILISLNRSHVWVAGTKEEPLPHQLNEIVNHILEMRNKKEE